MGDAERRDSIRQSIRRLAAISAEAIGGMELEEVEMREQQLVTHFRRFHELHLDIVAGGDAIDDELRNINEQLMFDTEELYLVAVHGLCGEYDKKSAIGNWPTESIGWQQPTGFERPNLRRQFECQRFSKMPL